MTEAETREVLIEEITKIAPDVASEDVIANCHLQDELGLDSMDILNLVTALHHRLGVDIPEQDYPRIATLSSAVSYLQERRA